ncbi:MAG: hypothetical protein O7E52_16245, partial [Candidatus Poribacteria bacterium]|nr:hypothetical protein [Candidatus Poribacteria bacterium]
MAKRHNRRSKQHSGAQIGFQDSDLEWLAEQFQRQAAQTPDLTLEEFALGYGAQPKWIRRYINAAPDTNKKRTMSIGGAAKHFGVSAKAIRQWISSGNLNAELVRGDWRVYLNHQDISDGADGIMELWHGTTEDRGEAIREDGFKVQGAPLRRGIWFTSRPDFARRVALGRGQQRGEIPVVISCAIDLGKYTKFRRPSLHVYVFHSPLGKEVIRDISVADGHKVSKGQPQSIDVVVTKASGTLGILSWINSYLALQNEAPVNDDHPAVEAIHRWVEAEYESGRNDPISDDEMLLQV